MCKLAVGPFSRDGMTGWWDGERKKVEFLRSCFQLAALPGDCGNPGTLNQPIVSALSMTMTTFLPAAIWNRTTPAMSFVSAFGKALHRSVDVIKNETAKGEQARLGPASARYKAH